MGNEMGSGNTSRLQEEENSITQGGKSMQEAGHANGADIENHTVSVAEEEEEIEVQPPAESPKVEVKSNDGASDESNEIQLNSISNGSKDQDKSPANAADKAENQFAPVGKDKDYQEKEINGLPSNIPNEVNDPHTVEQKQDESEQEERIHDPAESPESEAESNSDGSDNSDIQPTSPSKHSNYQEIAKESEVEENLQHISDHQLEKQTSINKEDAEEMNSTFETISSPHDPEPLKFKDSMLDQPELAKVHADPPIHDSNLHIHEDLLGANLNRSRDENVHQLDTKIWKDMNDSVVSGSNLEMEMTKDDLTAKKVTLEEEVFCEDKLEIRDGKTIEGNDISKKPKIKSDLSNCEGINKEIPTEISPISTGSQKAEPEVTTMEEESLNTHMKVSESIDKCVVLAVETILIEKESELGEDKPYNCPTPSCEESVKESKADSANLSQSEFLMTELFEENNKKRITDFTCYSSEGNMDCIEDEKVAENSHLVDGHINDQIEASVEHSKDSQKEAEETVVESEILLTEPSLTDFKREEVSEERQIIEEIEEKTESSCGIWNNSEGRENREQWIFTTLTVEQEEVSLPMDPLSLAHPHENRKNNEMLSQNIQRNNDSIREMKQESYADINVTEASCFDPKLAETLVSVAELAIEKHEQDLPNHTAKSMLAVAECDAQETHLSEECTKLEMPSSASDFYQVEDGIGRFSTESYPNNSNAQAQMQKSPSFGLDLRIEARTDESDRTPLLYREKTAIEDFSTEADVSLGSPIAHTQTDQNTFQYQAMPEAAEEKVVRMERSDSEKLKTPFLGFLEKEEKGHNVVAPQKHENNITAKKANKETLNLQTKEVASTSPKSKEKRKARSSLFTNCMCCTTVIN